MTTRVLARSAVMTALVFVVTYSFIVPIPQTKGFFNLGEAAIYLAALLFGPLVGALAGGVGSALADLSLGFAQYAPFTLVIKAAEGAVVGAIARSAGPPAGRLGLAAGVLAALWLLRIEASPVRVAGLALLVAAVAGLLWARRAGGARVAARLGGMLAGGLVMVVGYFTVQAFILRLGAPAALAEVPYNLVQVAVGVIAGLAAAAATERAIPGLGR